MRVSHVMWVLCLLLGVPAQARADFIGSSLFRQGTAEFGGSPVTSVQELCSSTTNAPSSTDCSGTLAVAGLRPGVGNFSGTTLATGSASGQMTLGSAVSIDVWRVNQGLSGGDVYFANATSTGTITDTVNIGNTGALTTGFLQLAFLLDGISTIAYDEDTTDGFNPGPAVPTSGFTPYTFQSAGLSANGLGVHFASGVYTVDVPVVFGTDQSLSVQLQTSAGAISVLISEGYSLVTDYSHTATMSDALILDANHQLLSGATLTSASGYGYGGLTSPAPAPVPEPATLSLLGVGLAAGAFKRRRSRSRSTR
jgi:hypothetical protein